METQKNKNQKLKQLFKPLRIEDSKILVHQLRKCSTQCQIRLVLTSGLSIAGMSASNKTLFAIADQITLLLPYSSKYQKLGIPFSLIAGGEVVKQEFSGVNYKFGNEETRQIDENLTLLIKTNSLQAEFRPSYNFSKGDNKHLINLPENVELTDISYSQPTILYADWETLQRKKDSNFKIEFGFSIFNVNISPKLTLQGYTWLKLKGETFDWAAHGIPDKDEIVIEGRVDLVRKNSKFMRISSVELETIDQDLIAVVWNRTGMTDHETSNVWINGILGGISLKHVDHPLSFWEKLKNPLRIYGQVIHADVESTLGNKKWFLKAMAVGTMQETL